MKKQIALTFALVAGAMLTLVGCVSMPEGSVQDDSAMMSNYPWVELSGTEAQAMLSYPWANVGMYSEPTDDAAIVSLYFPSSAFSTEATDDAAAVSLNYPWTAFSDRTDEASNGLEMYPYVFAANQSYR